MEGLKKLVQREKERDSMKNSLYSKPYSTETFHNLRVVGAKKEEEEVASSFPLITGKGSIAW